MASVVHVMTTIWTTSLIPAINQLSNVAIGYIKRVYFVECKLDRRVLQRPPYVLRLPSGPRSRLKAHVFLWIRIERKRTNAAIISAKAADNLSRSRSPARSTAWRRNSTASTAITMLTRYPLRSSRSSILSHRPPQQCRNRSRRSVARRVQAHRARERTLRIGNALYRIPTLPYHGGASPLSHRAR